MLFKLEKTKTVGDFSISSTHYFTHIYSFEIEYEKETMARSLKRELSSDYDDNAYSFDIEINEDNITIYRSYEIIGYKEITKYVIFAIEPDFNEAFR